ncbi:uncharacterized protein LOC132639938 [Lycium barbarum]|uniref:uncharacterized protein LOC132639938 n=1 Tax=Lycium barbarum TaxID=112863 RepID=UPI00293E1BE5|nr:uncharacterized protein LOC132639938 [Lycium barbarum]
MGFPTTYTQWVMECVKTVSYNIKINGEPTMPFDAARGLRQGDPMSAFLFAIGMEYLSRMLNALKEFHFHPRGDLASVIVLQACFARFSQSSGLQANLGKSSVYFGGVSQAVQESILHKLGSHLGQPGSYRTQAERAQLIKSVLFGIQAFWAQIYILHTKVLKLIKAHCMSYLWSGSSTITKKALVAWDNVCTPKSVGGLNLTNMYLWNRAAIAKHWWDIAHKQNKMWIRWIHSYYSKQQHMDSVPVPKQANWMVRKMFEARPLVANMQIQPTGKNTIRQIYYQALTARSKMPWKCIMYKNAARPKTAFTMWLWTDY